MAFRCHQGSRQAPPAPRFATPRLTHTSRPRHVRVACSLNDPWATLGVPQTASEKEIKKAHRKLVLQHHPDVRKDDVVAHARFMRIQEAYELIMGKRQGKDIDNRPADKSGWQFHDWYWKFSLKRRKGKGPVGAAMADDEPPPGTLRQQWQSQMAGLKQKAAAKQSRQQRRRHGATEAAAGGPAGSCAARESVWRSTTSTTRNARTADKAAARQATAAAAHNLGGEQRAAPAVATGSQQQQQPSPLATAAASPAADGPDGMPLRHAAAAGAASPAHQHVEPERQPAQEDGSVDPQASHHGSGTSSRIERLRQLLEQAAALVRPGEEEGGAQLQAQARHSPRAQAGAAPAGRRHMRGRISLDQLAALLGGQQAQADGASSAVPADAHLHRRFEASMRAHRSEQQLHAEGGAGAGGAAADQAQEPEPEEQEEEEEEEPSQHQHQHGHWQQPRGAAHSRKFANRDEVEGRLSSQLAGLKRRAALKQEVDASC